MNRNAFYAVHLVLFALLVAIPPVFAEQPLSPEMRRSVEEYQKEKRRENLTGWKGILFYCPIQDQSNHALNEICEKSYTNADFLAASAKVKLTKARSGYEVGVVAAAGDLLVLEVELVATESGTPAAIQARLRAYVSYLNAVEQSQRKGQHKVRTMPRSGELTLWERTAIGASSGAAKDLVTPIAQAIEQNLKQLFADYLNARR